MGVCSRAFMLYSSVQYRDVSMLLRDPYAIHVICWSIIQSLQRLSEHSKLPRVRINSG